jgi:sugar lactone lactonase YvrE
LKTYWRAVLFAVFGAAALGSLYCYRTLQLGRSGAQPVFLDSVNPAGEMLGPAGIQFDRRGTLFAGDTQGFVWNLGSGEPALYADLKITQRHRERPCVGGIAFDADGNLYAGDMQDGGILRVDAGTKRVRRVAPDVGIPSGLILTADSRRLWVCDFRENGRVLQYRLDATSLPGPEVAVAGVKYPAGLALGADDSTIYAAEAYSGDVVRIGTGGGSSRVERIASLGGPFARGSLTGLAFDPRDRARRFLYVAENLRGVITVLDVRQRPARTIKQIRLALMGGRPCPAGLAILDGYMYVTDLWTCNPLRLLLGRPKWANRAYRFRVNDLSALYD